MTDVLDNIKLVMWNLGDGDPPLIESVRDHLEAAGLDRKHAADMPLSTAFRRACDELRNVNTAVTVFKTGKDLYWVLTSNLGDAKNSPGRASLKCDTSFKRRS